MGLETVGKILAPSGGAPRYGKMGSVDVTRCTPALALEMAQKALEIAKKDIDATWLSPWRQKLYDDMLNERLLRFAVASNLIRPDPGAQERMISSAYGLVEDVIKSGWLTRNEVKVQ